MGDLTMTLSSRRLLAVSAVAFLLPAGASAAGDRGRWLLDGFGRAPRDGGASSCVASGGPDHAFAVTGCERDGSGIASARELPSAGTPGVAAAATSDASMPATILVSAREPAAPAGATAIRDSGGKAVRDGLVRSCVHDARRMAGTAGAGDCDASPEPSAMAADDGLARRISMPPPEVDRSTLTASGSRADVSKVAIETATAGAGAPGTASPAATAGTNVVAEPTVPSAAALADPDDDEDDSEKVADAGDDDDDQDESAMATGPVEDAAVLALDGETTSPADDPGYAPGSVELTDRSPGTTPPPTPVRETPPVIDNNLPTFPITRHSIESVLAEEPDKATQRTGNRRLVSTNALFDSGSASLKSADIPELDDFVRTLLEDRHRGRVLVTGHTDRLGSDDMNLRLSRQRADTVRAYLLSRGLDPAQVVATGRGKAAPVTQPENCQQTLRQDLRVCLAPDRRVEITASGDVGNGTGVN